MKRLRVCFILVMMLCLGSNPVWASQYIESNDNQVAFSVRATLPDNQISDASFFEIEMEPNQTQYLEVVITNTSDTDIQVELETHTGATNSNGVIVYDGSITEFNDSMVYSFGEISQPVEDIINVPAQSEATAQIKVESPSDSFDGQILGGIRFQLVEDDTDNTEAVTIQQKYAYVIGVNIVETGNTEEIQPEIRLDSANVETTNNQTQLIATFTNTTPILVRQLTFQGEILPENGEEVIYSREVDNFSVAPYSVFQFPIRFEEGNLISGNYVFRGTASNDDNQWTFEKAFTIE